MRPRFVWLVVPLAAQGCGLFDKEQVDEIHVVVASPETEEVPTADKQPSTEARPPPSARAKELIREQVSAEVKRLERLKRGERLYRRACATCHGLKGDGNGPSAAGLDPRPEDLASGSTSTRRLFEVISKGVPRTSMPGWQKLLSEEDRWSLVEHVKRLSGAAE